jgi:hypothetical protein
VPAVLLATALVIVLATWAASIGPDRVFGDDPTTSSRLSDTTDDRVAPEPAANRDDKDDDNERGWGSTALFGLELALLLFMLVLIAMGVRWVTLDIKAERRRRRRRRRSVGFEVLPTAPEQAVQEMVRDAGEQLALLRDGSPRNGIVACWHRFEVQAKAAGIGRQPWETSAEFTLRILDLVAADESAVAELAGLYREARFSDHEILESARASAVDALARIHRSLGARPVRGAP